MNSTADIAFKAGRLFHYAFNLRERPAQNAEYAQLINEYVNRSEMRCIFDQFVEACFLEVLEVSSVGVFLAPKPPDRRQGSTFCFRLADYKTFDDPHERVLQGTIQLVLASYVFPTPERLDDPIDSLGSPVRISEFVEYFDQLLEQFRQLCSRMPCDNPDEEPIWQRLRAMVLQLPTDSGRQPRHTLTRQVQIACSILEREGLFRKQEARAGDTEKFIPLPQYRVHVRHLADHGRLYEFISRVKGESQNA